MVTTREVLRVRAHDRRRVAAALRSGDPDHPRPVAGPLLLGAVLAVVLAVAETGWPQPFAHAVGGPMMEGCAVSCWTSMASSTSETSPSRGHR